MADATPPVTEPAKSDLMKEIVKHQDEFWFYGRWNHVGFVASSITIALCSIILTVSPIGDLLGNWGGDGLRKAVIGLCGVLPGVLIAASNYMSRISSWHYQQGDKLHSIFLRLSHGVIDTRKAAKECASLFETFESASDDTVG